MGRRPNQVAVNALALILAGILIAPGSVRAQGVMVQFTPLSQRVVPGTLVHIDITLTEAGSPINGFDALVGFDPAALTPVPRSPISDQIGLLMSGACGTHFHRFGEGNETPADSVTLVLLCAGASVTGPGQLYRLDFLASMTPQVTYVRFLPGLQFYNEGLYVTPVNFTDTIIGIGMDPPTSVDSDALHEALGIKVVPNPSHGETFISVTCDRSGPQRLAVVDLLGRVVWRIDESTASPGLRTIAWDGRDIMGNRVPSGVYFVTLDAPSGSVSKRVLLVR